MKSFLLLVIAVVFAVDSSYAQWTTSYPNISNANTGFVGISTALYVTTGNNFLYGSLPAGSAVFGQGPAMGVYIPAYSATNYQHYIILDQPNSQVLISNGNSDLGGGIRRPGFDGETRFFSNGNYNNTSYYMTFYNGGSEMARITGNGLGIGSVSPTARLEVQAIANASGRQELMRLTHSGQNTFVVSEFGGSHAIAPSTIQLAAWNAEQNVSIVTDVQANTEAGGSTKGIFIKSGGKVGMGTTAPAAGLHIVGTTEQLRLGYDATNYATFTTTSTGALTMFAPAGISVTTGFGFGGNFSSLWTSGGNGLMSPGVSQYALFGSNSTQLRVGERSNTNQVVNAGYSYGTHIIGQTQVTVGTSGTHPLFAQQVIKPLSITAGAAALTNTATLYLEDAATGATNNYNLWAAGTGVNRFDGWVGIGTPTPREALSVNGNIRSKQVKVDVSNWPDFVFKPGYQLLALSDLKTYVDKNHHLPDMPTEQEIADSGLNLGEINKSLTKKVEELTLYLIEKDRQVQQQQAQIDEIKKQVAQLLNAQKHIKN